jgi:hypothetical protein
MVRPSRHVGIKRSSSSCSRRRTKCTQHRPFQAIRQTILQSFDQATANTQSHPNSEIKRTSAARREQPAVITSTIT